jgi:hypothetical protein
MEPGFSGLARPEVDDAIGVEWADRHSASAVAKFIAAEDQVARARGSHTLTVDTRT